MREKLGSKWSVKFGLEIKKFKIPFLLQQIADYFLKLYYYYGLSVSFYA